MQEYVICGRNCDHLYKDFLLQTEEELGSLLAEFEHREALFTAFVYTNSPLRLHAALPYTTVLYVNKNSVNVRVNGVEAVLEEESFLLVNAHSQLELTLGNPEACIFGFLYKRSFFNAAFMKRLSDCEPFYNFINYCLMGREDYAAHAVFECGSYTTRQLVYILLSLVQNKSRDLMENALLFLFHCLVQLEESTLVGELSTPIVPSIANMMVKYIAAHCERVTLGGLAEHFNYHPNYVSGLIKKETGRSFVQHLQNAKLKKSAYLLASTGLRVRDIAMDLGYNDTSFFTKVFKEKYGCTPGQYRTQKRKSSA